MLSPSYYIKKKHPPKQVTQNTSTLEKTFFCSRFFRRLVGCLFLGRVYFCLYESSLDF